MANDKRVVHQGEGGGVETLPPAGDARREVLAQRADALEQKAEELGKDGGAIDPAALRIENEIAQHFDEMNVPAARSDYRYKWEQRDPKNLFGNRHVLRAQYLGWQIVCHDDPDARGLEHCRFVDGSIVIGDTVLMRMRLEDYIKQVRREREQVRRLEEGATAQLAEIAERHGARTYNDSELAGMNSGWSAHMEAAAREAKARQLANQQFDEMVRTGTVPGRPAPGRR